MPRRLPFLPLVLAVTVGLFALTTALTAQSTTPPAGAPGDGIKRTQEENLKLYKRFADQLLKLAQKWEKSDNPEERERAKSLRAALKLAEEKGIENLFKGMLNTLGTTKNPNGTDFENLFSRDRALVKALEEILETLNTEDESKRLEREIADLKELIRKANELKVKQENLRARTEGKADPMQLAKEQDRLAKDTQDLANKLAKGDPKDPKGDPKDGGKPSGDPKDGPSEPKAEAKPGDPASESKPDSQDPKSDGKDQNGKDGDPKGGEPKAGEPKDGMKDAGSSKESPKDGAGEPMTGKGMGEPKPMSTDPKNPMGSDPKNPMDAKPQKPSDSKSQGDGKGDSKPSDGMNGDGKPMSPMDGMPSDSPPSGGKSPPSGGSPSDSPPPSGKRPPNPNNPNDDAQRHVEEAVPPQQEAEKKLKEKNRDEASQKEDDAIRALDRAIKELEKRLKQLREKEMLKKLEDLERRVAKMLQMQIEVKAATERIDQSAKKNGGQLSTADKQKAGVEAEKEGAIAEEAEKALRVLEGEGTAIVFAGVLAEAKKDMESVQKQLNQANVGEDTQLVEQQIIDQLKQMLEALKKAKEDLENPPMPPMPGMPPPPSDPKKNLVQLIEQLKLLKALQVQVNERTIAFGKRTPKAQAEDPFVQEQLRQLGDRQKVLQGMLHKIATQLGQQ